MPTPLGKAGRRKTPDQNDSIAPDFCDTSLVVRNSRIYAAPTSYVRKAAKLAVEIDAFGHGINRSRAPCTGLADHKEDAAAARAGVGALPQRLAQRNPANVRGTFRGAFLPASTGDCPV